MLKKNDLTCISKKELHKGGWYMWKTLHEICPCSCDWNNTNQQSPASGNITCIRPVILQRRSAGVTKCWHSPYARKFVSDRFQIQTHEFSTNGRYSRITPLLSTGNFFHSSLIILYQTFGETNSQRTLKRLLSYDICVVIKLLFNNDVFTLEFMGVQWKITCWLYTMSGKVSRRKNFVYCIKPEWLSTTMWDK